ncbi:ATP-binding protein [Paenibacillus sp. PAMC21692]|uniref:ATP-binding protein n=1 Tax=Paenibacillus sp. PAMC21692 TaxID=2762320 RepID=UPI00164D3BF3|nr:ATP-binding protein [Paenibacillus sp. PAMC21692]QNK59810.1 ATP-binding protein [Paenibacillus sp. PAMC21692]
MSNEPHYTVDRSLQLRNDMQELMRLNEELEAIGAELDWSPRAVLDLSLACEELVVNIVNYGYPVGSEGFIEVGLRASQDEVEITLADRGNPFDPFKDPDPLDLLEMDVDDRPIGGLGIFFVKRLMDEVHYEFADGMNQVRLRKRWSKQ